MSAPRPPQEIRKTEAFDDSAGQSIQMKKKQNNNIQSPWPTDEKLMTKNKKSKEKNKICQTLWKNSISTKVNNTNLFQHLMNNHEQYSNKPLHKTAVNNA